MGIKNILQKKFCKKEILLKKFFCKNFFFQSEHVLSQIWSQKFFPLQGGGGPPKKVAQHELKHILVWEFLRSDDLLGEGGPSVRYKQPDNQTHAIVTR